MAFHVTASQNRFIGCYIDGSRAVLEGAGLSNNVWSHGFECCAGSGLDGVPHGIELLGNAVGPGLVITHNIFAGGSVFSTPTSNASAVSVSGTLIEANSFGGRAAGSRVTQVVTLANAATATVDFCAALVFPSINHVTLSVTATAGFPVAVARPPTGCSVVVETSTAMTGSIAVTVDSSAQSAGFI